jgi:hypothetical protein
MKQFIGRSTVLFFCALAVSAVGAGQLFAQQSEEKARALVYHDGVPEGPDSTGTYLTRNSLDKVKAYYQDLKGKMDTVRAWEGERGTGSVGYTFTYKYTVQGGPPTEWASATIWRIDEEKYRSLVASQSGGALSLETAQPLPLSQLKVVLQGGASGHTQAEYDGLVRKYRHLQFSFFREVKDEKGEQRSEDKVIYDRYSKQVYGDASAPAKKGGGDKARKQQQKETAARIKELKAQGKTAEAMALAMQMQQEMMSGGAGEQYRAMAQGPMRKDAWDIWVRCLEDMNKAAYPVKIEAGSAMYPDLH